MFSSILKFVFSFLVMAFAVCMVSGQTDASNSGFGRERPIDPPKNFREMQARQRLEKEKKQHEETVARAEKALAISEELEESFESNSHLSRSDVQKLGELEGIVNKIRKDLGGSGDDDRDGEFVKNENPTSHRDAFEFLKTNTRKLVDELKKNTRYTVSVVAIQSSNAVLKMVKFLRLNN